jgi:hypothetical protein
MNLVRRHGGCEITSDNLIEIIASPADLLARMGWGKAVSKARENCVGY